MFLTVFMALAVLGLGLILVLCIADGGLDQVLDVALDVLPEVEHVGVGRGRGQTVLLAPVLVTLLLWEPVTTGCLNAVILADVVIHLLAVLLHVSQFRL